MPRIGPIHLPLPFCQAGLAGYSDRAMRLVARRNGCPYAVTEALLDIILVNGGTFSTRDTHVRISYARPMAELKVGIPILAEMMK